MMPFLLFLKKQQNLKLSSAAIIGGALRVKDTDLFLAHTYNEL